MPVQPTLFGHSRCAERVEDRRGGAQGGRNDHELCLGHGDFGRDQPPSGAVVVATRRVSGADGVTRHVLVRIGLRDGAGGAETLVDEPHADQSSPRISPDGARALVLLREGGRDQVAIAGVVRGADGEPTSLAEPRAMVPAATAVRDLAWIDESSVAVLGEPADDGQQEVWRADVGGWTESQGHVDNAVAIAGYPDEREDGILITTDGGRVLTKAGATWFVATAASDVIVPGR